MRIFYSYLIEYNRINRCQEDQPVEKTACTRIIMIVLIPPIETNAIPEAGAATDIRTSVSIQCAREIKKVVFWQIRTTGFEWCESDTKKVDHEMGEEPGTKNVKEMESFFQSLCFWNKYGSFTVMKICTYIKTTNKIRDEKKIIHTYSFLQKIFKICRYLK